MTCKPFRSLLHYSTLEKPTCYYGHRLTQTTIATSCVHDDGVLRRKRRRLVLTTQTKAFGSSLEFFANSSATPSVAAIFYQAIATRLLDLVLFAKNVPIHRVRSVAKCLAHQTLPNTMAKKCPSGYALCAPGTKPAAIATDVCLLGMPLGVPYALCVKKEAWPRRSVHLH